MIDGKTYSPRGTDVVEKGSEVIRELLEGIFLKFVGLIGLTVT
jgi:hypothetical protein